MLPELIQQPEEIIDPSNALPPNLKQPFSHNIYMPNLNDIARLNGCHDVPNYLTEKRKHPFQCMVSVKGSTNLGVLEVPMLDDHYASLLHRLAGDKTFSYTIWEYNNLGLIVGNNVTAIEKYSANLTEVPDDSKDEYGYPYKPQFTGFVRTLYHSGKNKGIRVNGNGNQIFNTSGNIRSSNGSVDEMARRAVLMLQPHEIATIAFENGLQARFYTNLYYQYPELYNTYSNLATMEPPERCME